MMKKILTAILAIVILSHNAYADGAEIIRLDMKTDPEKPGKYEYLIGEALDLTDMYITVTYENGEKQDVKITEDMVSGYDANTPGAQIITVKYEGRSTSFAVKVVEKYSETVTAIETIDFDTSPETRSPDDEKGKPDIVIIIAVITVSAAAAALCIAAILKPKKKEER